MKLHKYSEEQLIEAVKSSSPMRQVLQKLGVAPYGGNYDVLRKAIGFFGLKHRTSLDKHETREKPASQTADQKVSEQ